MTKLQKTRLKVFMYLLLRDELPSGKVVRLINEVQESFTGGHRPTEARYSSPGIALHAEEMVDRLLDTNEDETA